jgi:hypothetical protein
MSGSLRFVTPSGFGTVPKPEASFKMRGKRATQQRFLCTLFRSVDTGKASQEYGCS